MTDMIKERYLRMRTIGYWSEYGGIELKDIEYGINDYAVVVSGAFSANRRCHKVMIHTNKNGRQFIMINGRRYYFDNCLRN